jgi:pseudouridine kinase
MAARTDAGGPTAPAALVPRGRVLCVGGAVVDLKIRLDAPSVPGTSNPGTASTSFGGVARNVAENLAGLLSEAAVDLVSAVGADGPGSSLLQHLRGCGIGTEHVAVLPGETTAQYVAVLEPGGDLVIGTAVMAVLDRIDRAALDAAWPRASPSRPGPSWVFCDGNLSATVLAHALARGRTEETPVAVDAVSTAKVTRLPADLHGLALLSCNRDEARAWLSHHRRAAPAGDDVALALALTGAGAAAVLLTRGAAGLVAAEGDTVAQIPAVPAAPIDVTGAGDALIAGTLAALIGGTDLVTAAKAGAERAARTVESRHSVLPPTS